MAAHLCAITRVGDIWLELGHAVLESKQTTNKQSSKQTTIRSRLSDPHEMNVESKETANKQQVNEHKQLISAYSSEAAHVYSLELH